MNFRHAGIAGTFLVVVATAMVFASPATSAPSSGAQGADEAAAVQRAALDYLEGFYEGDAAKLERSVRPEVVKYGFERGGSTGFSGSAMSFDQMISFANRVKASGRQRPASDPKEVEILDILDQTAAVKVTAYWGTDYLQLAKYDGRWMILHILWQTPSGSSD